MGSSPKEGSKRSQKNILGNVYIDESGHTGSNLIDTIQPTFALASISLTEENCTALLKILPPSQSAEYRFKKLRKSKRGQQAIIELLSHELINESCVKVNIFHKKYMIVTLIVDRIIEPILSVLGIDLYKNGLNIAMSHLIFYCLPAFYGEDEFIELLKSFIIMSEQKNSLHISNFYEKIKRLRRLRRKNNINEVFDIILRTQPIATILLKSIDKYSFDPSLPAFFSMTNYWGDQYPQGFNIIHDDTKSVKENKSLFELYMNKKMKSIKVGYDRRMLKLPLKCHGIYFENSKSYGQLQLADIIAGACNYWARELIINSGNDCFFNNLDKLDLNKIIMADTIWPSDSLAPHELDTEFIGGTHPLDGAVDFLIQSKKLI